MYGQDILCGISKGTFEIPHKISYPYIERCRFYSHTDLKALIGYQICYPMQTWPLVSRVLCWPWWRDPRDPSHKSQNADKYPTMHHFVTEMCTYEHISVTKWCIVGYGTGTLWDVCSRSIIGLSNVQYIRKTIVWIMHSLIHYDDFYQHFYQPLAHLSMHYVLINVLHINKMFKKSH